jgi:hypothetical protein
VANLETSGDPPSRSVVLSPRLSRALARAVPQRSHRFTHNSNRLSRGNQLDTVQTDTVYGWAMAQIKSEKDEPEKGKRETGLQPLRRTALALERRCCCFAIRGKARRIYN